MTNRTAEDIREDIRKMIADIEKRENVQCWEDRFADRLIESVDEWNDLLDGEHRLPMECLADWYPHTTDGTNDLIQALYYGHDDESEGQFDPNKRYFFLDGYGNIVSTDFKDYEYELDDIALCDDLDRADELIVYPELKALFEELAEALNA